MPLSDWQPLPIVTTGDMWTAAQHNTYIRANQQALYDGLTQSHGAASDVDMVDGRHAALGAFPGLVPVDKLSLNMPEGTADWLTIATTASDGAHGVFTLIEKGVGATGVCTLWATVDQGGMSHVYVIAGRWGTYVTGARIVDDGAGTYYLQVRADVPTDGNGARSLDVYMQSVNDGTLWSLGTATPPTANLHLPSQVSLKPAQSLLVNDTLDVDTGTWVINIPNADKYPVLHILIIAHGTRTADAKDAIDAFPNGDTSTSNVFSAILHEGSYLTYTGKWLLGTIATDGIADSRGPQAFGIISARIFHNHTTFPVMFAKNVRNTPGAGGNLISWGRYAQPSAIISSITLQPLNALFKAGSQVLVYGLREVTAW